VKERKQASKEGGKYRRKERRKESRKYGRKDLSTSPQDVKWFISHEVLSSKKTSKYILFLFRQMP
jgi:hypothetical protein